MLVPSDLDQVIAREPDLVFLGMKLIPNDLADNQSDIWINQRLSKAGILFTGSGEVAAKLEHNKYLAKEKVSEHGLATACSQIIKQGEKFSDKDIALQYPIFIKPVDGGGGSGINELSLVHDFAQLQKQTTWLLGLFKSNVLLESYLSGREFSVGLLRKQGTNNYHTMPLEIIAPKNKSGERFLSSQIKSSDLEQTHAVSNKVLKKKINELALGVFNVLGGSDYGRIDIRLDAYGVPHFLEANLLPSLLNDYGNLPKASLINMNLSHNDLIFQITELGLTSGRGLHVSKNNQLNYYGDSTKQKLNLQLAR